MQQNIPTAYVQFWSGAVDYQVMKNSVLSFEYTGSKGTHEYDIANLNAGRLWRGVPGRCPCPNRLNYQYSNINYRGSRTDSTATTALNVKFQTNNLFNKGLYLTRTTLGRTRLTTFRRPSRTALPAITGWDTWIRSMPT